MTATAPSSRSATLRTVLLVIGSIVIVIVLSITAMRVAAAVTRQDSSGAVPVSDEFDAVELRTSASDVTIDYRDVDETTLEFRQGDSTDVSFEHGVTGNVLRIVIEHRGWWGWDFGGEGSALEVTLPQSLQSTPISVDLTSAAGDVVVDGRFDAMSVESTAGDVRLSGGATELTLTTTAGDARVEDFALRGDLVGESTADDVFYDFSSIPDGVHIESTAGNVSFTVPEGDYRIETTTTAGEIDSRVSSDVDSDRVFEFRTTAGDILITNR